LSCPPQKKHWGKNIKHGILAYGVYPQNNPPLIPSGKNITGMGVLRQRKNAVAAAGNILVGPRNFFFKLEPFFIYWEGRWEEGFLKGYD